MMRSEVEFVALGRGEGAVVGTHSTTMSSEHEQQRSRPNGEDASWPDDHRDVVALVLEEIEDRITALWRE